jgi:hypothetical protein
MYAPNVFTLDVAGMMSGATDLSRCLIKFYTFFY